MAKMKAKKKTSSRGAVAHNSQASLADAVGVTPKTMSLWMRDSECPIRSRPPWTDADVESLRRWRQTLAPDKANPSEPTRLVDANLKLERMLKVKLERQILEKAYVAVDDVKQEWSAQARRIKHTMMGVGPAVAVQFPDDDAHKIEHAIKEEITLRLHQLSIDREPMTDDKAA